MPPNLPIRDGPVVEQDLADGVVDPLADAVT
jgi:hypothetical protein